MTTNLTHNKNKDPQIHHMLENFGKFEEWCLICQTFPRQYLTKDLPVDLPKFSHVQYVLITQKFNQ